MSDRKLNIDKYIHYGFATYEEYYIEYGDVQAVEDAIIEDAKKYIELIKSGYKYTLDKLMTLTDITNRTTIQEKFVVNIKFLYIVKPVKNLLYILLNEQKYYEQYQRNLSGSYIDFLIDTESDHKILNKKIREFYDIDIKGTGLNKEVLRKKLFFKKDDLKCMIKEVFKIEVDALTYAEIPDKSLNKIIKQGIKSQKTLVEEYKILGSTQFKRYVKSKKIDVALKVVIPSNNPKKRSMARYLLQK